MAKTLSDFGIPNEEVRGIQAKLYEAAMKQTLTLETLKTYREHLDTDIKIVVGPHCYAEGDRFENNFYKRRQKGVGVEETADKYTEAIKIGYCQGCENTVKNNQYKYVEYAEVFGVSLLHCLMMSDRNLPLIAFLQEAGCNMKKPTLSQRYSPLTLAVSDNQVEIVKYFVKHCKHRFCSSTDFVHIEQKWLATATEIVVLTKMVAISTDFVHFGQKW